MEISCDFKREIWTSGIIYTAVVRSINLNVGKVSSSLEVASGKHAKGKDNKDVQGLIFGTILSSIPENIGILFPNLTCLAFTNCDLKTIKRDDFKGLFELSNIDFSNNEIESLPDDLFDDTPKVARVRFSENNISRVSSRLFVHLAKKSLFRINLRNNKLIDNYWYKDEHNTFEALMMEIDEKCLPPSDSHAGRLETLFRTGKGSDLTVKVGGKSIKAHKSILMAQSSVLAKAIDEDMEGPQSNVITIEGFSSEVIEDLLMFCYVGKLFSLKNMIGIAEAAAKYEIPALPSFCKQNQHKNK